MTMRLLADMGVSHRVVEWLRREGHDVAHLRERGLHRLEDVGIMKLATQENRIVLTFDLDFSDILAASGATTPSTIVFRLRNTRSQFVYQRVSGVMAAAAQALREGAIVMIEEGRHRIRRLPIGS